MVTMTEQANRDFPDCYFNDVSHFDQYLLVAVVVVGVVAS